jgi:dihydroorotate dehydrogenase electron transfer subunit
MAKVISNEKIADDFMLLSVREDEADFQAAARGGTAALPSRPNMGQFYMLRAWDTEPLLSRPVSVFDAEGRTVSFLYRIAGRGTRIFARLKREDTISLFGPLGNGFVRAQGRVALAGGGAGIAPLYFAAKEIRRQSPSASVDIFLGFSGTPMLEEKYRAVCAGLSVKTGGFITDEIHVEQYDFLFACGPGPMMKTLYEKCRTAAQDGKKTPRLQVSLERRMACGSGACYVCTCMSRTGNKKVCKDGPVFDAAEVYGL